MEKNIEKTKTRKKMTKWGSEREKENQRKTQEIGVNLERKWKGGHRKRKSRKVEKRGRAYGEEKSKKNEGIGKIDWQRGRKRNEGVRKSRKVGKSNRGKQRRATKRKRGVKKYGEE